MAVALDCTLYVSYVLKITLQHLTISINSTTASLHLQANNDNSRLASHHNMRSGMANVTYGSG